MTASVDEVTVTLTRQQAKVLVKAADLGMRRGKMLETTVLSAAFDAVALLEAIVNVRQALGNES